MNRFFSRITLLALLAATSFVSSCSSDDVQATINLQQEAVYFSELGESAVITYTGSNIASLTTEDVPDGWYININKGDKKITVFGPTTYADFEASKTSTVVTFTAISVDDDYDYDYLTLGTTNSKNDLSTEQSNSFFVSSPNTIYTFDCMKGESGELFYPESVNILWQSYPTPLSYAALLNGNQVEFHVAIDEDDADEDDDETDLLEGNAVIAAYDSDGDIIWSWHVWVSDYSIEDDVVTLNGNTIMGRNLGANANSTFDAASILGSYGMYYQWGRKDPFIGAYYYNAASGSDATMKNGSGSGTYITYQESTSGKGKESYARKNPLTFLLGVEDSTYDWLYSAHSSQLWSDTKTINDPCPKGWRVASPETFEGLMLPTLTDDEMADIVDDYGWELTDSQGNSSLFMGLGRRGYITGKIQNVNLNAERPAPWAGYYWTTASTVGSTQSTAMYYSYDGQDPAGNEFYLSNYYRSNGMQVRCQRDEE